MLTAGVETGDNLANKQTNKQTKQNKTKQNKKTNFVLISYARYVNIKISESFL